MKFVLRTAAFVLAASIFFPVASSAAAATISDAVGAVPEHASSTIVLLAFAGLGLATRSKRGAVPVQIV